MGERRVWLEIGKAGFWVGKGGRVDCCRVGKGRGGGVGRWDGCVCLSYGTGWEIKVSF